MTEEVKAKDDKIASTFIISISKVGRVSVDIKGDHINKTTFNRLILGLKKAYNQSIRDYRKTIQRVKNAKKIAKLNENK